MNRNTSLKVSYNDLLLFGILVILTTVLRASLLIVAPFLIIFILTRFGFTFRKPIIHLLAIIIVSYIISLSNGFYTKYNLLSFYYIIPFLFLLFSKPKYYFPKTDMFSSCMKILTALTVINNLVGLLQYINFPNDDSFTGLYGHFTVTQNGLAIINGILFYYYLRKLQLSNKSKDLLWCAFFGISFIMGFYGGGVLVLGATITLQTLQFDTRKLFRKILLGFVIIAAIGFTIYLVRPDTLRYNLNIISLFAGKKGEKTPRKLLSYRNYVRGYSSDWKDAIFGSGPGTFNSRSAFIIGSQEYFKMPGIFKSTDQPYYFKNYAYPLWNAGNTGRFQDGFMNQPFSSMLAFLGEYGLLFTLCLIVYYIRQNKTVIAYPVFSEREILVKDLYKFCSIFLVLLLIIDNYMEYPEITILILLLMKLAEMELIKSNNIKIETDAQ
jgi:hypothetical protein